MRVAVIGRTKALIDAAHRLAERGHQIGIVWTSPHDGYYAESSAADFDMLARAVDADFVSNAGIGRSESIARLRASCCDVAVSVNWLTVLSADVIGAFPRGVLNAHAGDLPRFRGNAVVNWAILNGEPHVGLCVHQMVPELDAGPVYGRRRFPLGPDTYVGEVWRWIDATIPQMFAETVDSLATGTFEPEPQSTDPRHTLRAYPRRPEDARIDWTRPALEIYRLVRANSRPYDGAFTTLEGQTNVRIWRAAPTPHHGAFLAVPGQVCFRIDNDPVVACGDGMLRLTEIGIEGCENEAAKTLVHRSLRARLR